MLTRNPRSRALILAATVIGFCASARADDWPTYRHDHRRSAVSHESPDTLRLVEAWRWKSPSAPLAAWPGPARWDAYAGIRGLRAMRNYDPAFHVIAADGSIFFGSNSDDTVRRVDADTGSVEWSFTADGPVRIAPEFADGRIYFGADDGHAYCLNAKDGKLQWRHRPVEPKRWLLNDGRMISPLPIRSGVLVQDGMAYFAASLAPWKESYLCCVDAIDGSTDNGFTKSVGEGKTLEGALLSSSTDLIQPQGRVAPLIFDLRDGESKGSLSGGGGSFVLLTDDDEILHGPGNKQGVIQGSNADRKKVASFENGNAIVVSGNTSYLLSDTSLAAYDRRSKKIRWLVPADAPFDLILVGDILFAAGNGHVSAYTTTDGSRVWSADVAGRSHGLAFANGRLYATTETGVIHCFAPTDRELTQPLSATAHQAAMNQKPDNDSQASAPIRKVSERGLLDRWVFQRNAITDPKVNNQSRPLPATVSGRFQVKPAGDLEALELDGATNDVVVLQQYDATKAPGDALTAETWVRIDAPLDWGGLLSISQDNGAYERGWILGFRGKKFGFAVAGEKGNDQLTWIVSPDEFILGSWHHVAGTYNGTVQRLYVDGEMVAESKVQRGKIRYPDKARYVVGSYWDKDEHFRMRGALHEARLYNRALDARMISRHVAEKSNQLPTAPVAVEDDVAQLASGPVLRFKADGSATVQWETKQPAPSRLVVHLDSRVVQERSDPSLKTSHEVRLQPLAPSTLFSYRIYLPRTNTEAETDDASTPNEKWIATREFGCDTHFNYARMNGSAFETTTSDPNRWPVTTGLAIVLDDQSVAESLAAETAMYVSLISDQDAIIADARTDWIAEGIYGPRLTARRWDERIPTRSAALIVANKGGDIDDLVPLLQPDGKLLLGEQIVAVGAPLEGASAWTHMYGRPNNSAYGGESLGGAKSYDDLTLQWLGRPGPRYQSDRGNRKPAPLAAGGRLYMQGLNRLIAVNAYSGVILWSVELPALQRFNIPRDTCNWCADESRVWLSMQDRVWKLDGATGRFLESRTINRPEGATDEVSWGFLARVEDQLLGSAVAEGGHFTDWWGGASWYDGKSGALTHKVCSMNLISYDAESGDVQWTHERGGAIVNPTITVVGDLVIFAENPNLFAKKKSRFDDNLFSQLKLVALDRKTGKVRWEQPLEQRDGTAACYVAATSKGIVYQTSSKGAFDISVRDPETGTTRWTKTYPWEVDHHGKHISRPAIMGDRVIIRPYVLDMKTGEKLNRQFPKGHQCGTYTCTDSTIFLRAGDMTMWDLEKNTSTRLNRVRPDCWISTIPAMGMLLSPEGGGGCSCGSWLETSMGFIPNVHAKPRATE